MFEERTGNMYERKKSEEAEGIIDDQTFCDKLRIYKSIQSTKFHSQIME